MLRRILAVLVVLAAVPAGAGVVASSTNKSYCPVTGSGSGSGAPTDATYITQTANGSLSAEQALGSLSTGCLGSATTTGVVSARTITGTAEEITVANGDCSGNPTLSLPTALTFTGKTITNGTFVTPAITTSQTTTRDGIGSTSTDGIILQNTTAAAAGAQQYSPRTCWTGQGWKTAATAASQSVTFCLENRPVQGSSAPTGTYALMTSINGGAYSDVATFTSGGQLTTTSNVVGTQFFAGATGGISWTGRSIMKSPADGVWNMTNNGATTLVQLRATGAPTVAGSCGTSPTVTGQDSALKIAVGTGSPTSCTVTFQGTWTTAPVCVANATATTTPLNVATTTTTVIVSSAALTASEVLHVACIGF